MTDLGISFHDIAFKDNQIWYAVESASEPVQVFTGSGSKVFSISSSIIPGANGMTFDDEGYLWVSDADADLIYKVDLNPTGISGQESGGLMDASVEPSINPSYSSVTLQLGGFESIVSVRIVDLSGRTVFEQSAGSQLVWDGSDHSGNPAPAGTYVVVAADASGRYASTRLVRL